MPDTRYSTLDSAIWDEITRIYQTLDKPGQVERFNTLVRLLEFVTRNEAMINSGGEK